MIQLDITSWLTVSDADGRAMRFSGSRCELGENAAQQTWGAALTYAGGLGDADWPDPLDAADIDDIRDYVRGLGAWDADEIDAMSDRDLRAMLVQTVASAVREYCSFDGWDEHREAACDGRTSYMLDVILDPEGDISEAHLTL